MKNYQKDAMDYFLETQLLEKISKAKTSEEVEVIYKTGRKILVANFSKINTVPFIKNRRFDG